MLSLWHNTLDVILPDHCVLCEQLLLPRPARLLCVHCWYSLPFNRHSCRGCALPLAADNSSEYCPGCAPAAALGLNANISIAALRYENAARHLVHRLKFQQGFREGEVLAAAMAEQARQVYNTNLPELLVPVPLSWRNHLHRGYNQAAWLAAGISRRLQLPVSAHLLSRRHGPAQRKLSRTARQRLSMRTFQLRRPPHVSHVAIVDDVLTTGRTTEVIRQLLLQQQQVQRVDIWAASRAIL